MKINRKKSLKAVINLIDKLATMGVLVFDEYSALQKAVSELTHAMSVQDYILIAQAVSKIAELLMKVKAHQS